MFSTKKRSLDNYPDTISICVLNFPTPLLSIKSRMRSLHYLVCTALINYEHASRPRSRDGTMILRTHDDAGKLLGGEANKCSKIVLKFVTRMTSKVLFVLRAYVYVCELGC